MFGRELMPNETDADAIDTGQNSEGAHIGKKQLENDKQKRKEKKKSSLSEMDG